MWARSAELLFLFKISFLSFFLSLSLCVCVSVYSVLVVSLCVLLLLLLLPIIVIVEFVLLFAAAAAAAVLSLLLFRALRALANRACCSFSSSSWEIPKESKLFFVFFGFSCKSEKKKKKEQSIIDKWILTHTTDNLFCLKKKLLCFALLTDLQQPSWQRQSGTNNNNIQVDRRKRGGMQQTIDSASK